MNKATCRSIIIFRLFFLFFYLACDFLDLGLHFLFGFLCRLLGSFHFLLVLVFFAHFERLFDVYFFNSSKILPPRLFLSFCCSAGSDHQLTSLTEKSGKIQNVIQKVYVPKLLFHQSNNKQHFVICTPTNYDGIQNREIEN